MDDRGVFASRTAAHGSRRRFLLGLVSAGLVYAVPTLTGMDEAHAHSHGTRRSRRHTRYTRYSHGSRRSHYGYSARRSRSFRRSRRDEGGFRRD